MTIQDLGERDVSVLAFRMWGTGAPRVLLIHGFCDGGFAWHEYESLLSGCFSGVTIDLRGHGASPWNTLRGYRREDLAADVIHTMDRLDLKELTLIGHSLGAELAIRAAAARPWRTRALVVVDGGPDLEEQAARIVQQSIDTTSWEYDTIDAFVAVLAERHPLAQAGALRHYAESALRQRDDGRFELKVDPALRRGLPIPDTGAIWSALDVIRCPKLLVRGAVSALLSKKKAAHVSTRVRNCRLVTVPRAGHSVALDNPNGLYAATTPFLDEVATSAHSPREAPSSLRA